MKRQKQGLNRAKTLLANKRKNVNTNLPTQGNVNENIKILYSTGLLLLLIFFFFNLQNSQIRISVFRIASCTHVFTHIQAYER